MIRKGRSDTFHGQHHAGGALDIQYALAVPAGSSHFAEAIEWTSTVREAAARLLGSPGVVADQGGLADLLPTNEAALALVTEVITTDGLTPGQDVAIAVDLAATQFAHDGAYHLTREDRVLPTETWLAELATWCSRYPVVSLEDLLAEDDWEGWQQATATAAPAPRRRPLRHPPDRLEHGILRQEGNAVLVKPNQAGTLTRARLVLDRVSVYKRTCTTSYG
ncbi:hypothetical protein [Streptomyces spinoverrucosus]|uniref:hypothetical protein n=1 Tax=Streptomyces spinoverrucosus TaxID=284043 RepID=UPI00142EBCB5|nr:hypothetical protein [Streptomyces spinoverrucosus]